MKGWLVRALTFLLLISAGCSEYDIRKIPEVPAPEIEVTPLEHDYGPLSVSESSNLDISIKNIGNDILDVSDIELIDSAENFSLYSDSEYLIGPNEEITISVSYSPTHYSDDRSSLKISSNDSDESVVIVDLIGSGNAPMIKITPDYYDFESVYLGCEESLDLKIENIGNVNLEVYDIDYLANIPADMHVEDFFDIISSFPATIPPGGAIDLKLDYIPLDTLNDAAFLRVHSNDPMNSIAEAEQYGLGEYENIYTETFEQDGIIDVDILFVIDNSGSMSANQTNLKNNFSSFINIFSLAGASYHIGFITTDSPDLVNNSIVSDLDSDPVSEAEYIIDSIGTSGSASERGIDMAYMALDSGGDAALGSSFQRDGARFVLIFVSDEKDHSYLYDHLELIVKIESLKSSFGLVSAHAVAGDYPSGCSGNGGAEFGEGYYDVLSHFYGSLLSICSGDWGFDLDEIARDSILLNQFPLSQDAIPDSISVTVDGVSTSDWTFEESTNSVIFDATPATGSQISITYSSWSCL
jgi:hypothetical protein